MNRDRLASVQRIRKIQERRARGALAMDHRHHREAVDAEASTWHALDARHRPTVEVGSAAGFHRTRAITDAGVLAAKLQQEVALEAARQVHRSTETWTVAARRVEALERLGDRLSESEREENCRREANEMDDLVLARIARELRGRS